MADVKISELPRVASLQPSDLLLVVTNNPTSPVSKAIENKNLFGTIGSNVSITDTLQVNKVNVTKLTLAKATTPANSSVNDTLIPLSSILYDDNYLYVKTSTGLIKRIALQTF